MFTWVQLVQKRISPIHWDHIKSNNELLGLDTIMSVAPGTKPRQNGLSGTHVRKAQTDFDVFKRTLDVSKFFWLSVEKFGSKHIKVFQPSLVSWKIPNTGVHLTCANRRTNITKKSQNSPYFFLLLFFSAGGRRGVGVILIIRPYPPKECRCWHQHSKNFLG